MVDMRAYTHSIVDLNMVMWLLGLSRQGYNCSISGFVLSVRFIRVFKWSSLYEYLKTLIQHALIHSTKSS